MQSPPISYFKMPLILHIFGRLTKEITGNHKKFCSSA